MNTKHSSSQGSPHDCSSVFKYYVCHIYQYEFGDYILFLTPGFSNYPVKIGKKTYENKNRNLQSA